MHCTFPLFLSKMWTVDFLLILVAQGSMTGPGTAFVGKTETRVLGRLGPVTLAGRSWSPQLDLLVSSGGQNTLSAGLCSFGVSALVTLLARFARASRKKLRAGDPLRVAMRFGEGPAVETQPKKRDVGVILLSAGKGGRMKADRPKQYLKISGREMVLRSLDIFMACEEVSQIVIVCADEYRGFFEEAIAGRFAEAPVVSFAEGGKERQFSVMNGLDKITSEYVAVHDCARPLVTQESISNVFAEARQHGAAVLAVPTKATIKVACSVEEPMVATTPDRSLLWEAQTPQVMQTDILRKGFSNAIDKNLQVTDDASVLEALGLKVKLTLGDYTNFKLTTPEDIGLAETILKERGDS